MKSAKILVVLLSVSGALCASTDGAPPCSNNLALMFLSDRTITDLMEEKLGVGYFAGDGSVAIEKAIDVRKLELARASQDPEDREYANYLAQKLEIKSLSATPPGSSVLGEPSAAKIEEDSFEFSKFSKEQIRTALVKVSWAECSDFYTLLTPDLNEKLLQDLALSKIAAKDEHLGNLFSQLNEWEPNPERTSSAGFACALLKAMRIQLAVDACDRQIVIAKCLEKETPLAFILQKKKQRKEALAILNRVELFKIDANKLLKKEAELGVISHKGNFWLAFSTGQEKEGRPEWCLWMPGVLDALEAEATTKPQQQEQICRSRAL